MQYLKKEIKSRRAAGFGKIPPEVWKTRKFDNIILQLYNAVYKQNTIEKYRKGCILSFSKKGNFEITKNYYLLL